MTNICPDQFGGYALRGADLIRQAIAEPLLRIGVPDIDVTLPWRGLPSGLHEIASPSGDGAGAGFAAALIARRPGPLLWCRMRDTDGAAGKPYGPGLQKLGLVSDRLILVEAARQADLLWAIEEGLRTKGLAGVVGERTVADLTASRRLQLAAERGKGLAFLLPASSKLTPSFSALTRWHVRSIPSVAEARGPGRPRWLLDLWRCREGGRPQSWIVEWNNATVSLDLAAELADRPLASAAA